MEYVKNTIEFTFSPLFPTPFNLQISPYEQEAKEMNHRINPRNVPIFLEQLAKEGYTLNVEYSKKIIRITCEGSSLRYLIPFGQTRLTEFGG